MNNLRLFACILIICSSGLVFGQDHDFGIWYGFNANHKLAKKLELKLSSNVRTFENASRIDQAYIEGGVSYKINDFLSTAGSYRLTGKLENDDSYHIRHKLFAEFKGTLPLKDLTFSGRLMFQMMKRTYQKNTEDAIPDYVGRFKIKASYDIPKFPVNPYIYFETFIPLFVSSEYIIEKERFSAGLTYKISKKHSVETGYILERYSLPQTAFYHVVSLTYELSF